MASTLKIVAKHEIAVHTLEVQFEKPGGFHYLPGQNINLILPQLHYEDAKGRRRTFTLASAPYEDKLLITTRLTDSGYKKTLAELPHGSECEYLGPQGKFVYDETVKKAIWLAGGIGITPFRSMLLQALHQGPLPEITLFYSNPNLEAAAYHDLFLRMSEEHKFFHYIPIFTHLPDEHSWAGERRLINSQIIAEYEPRWLQATVFICGPPGMVTSLSEQMQSQGLWSQQLRIESLWGY